MILSLIATTFTVVNGDPQFYPQFQQGVGRCSATDTILPIQFIERFTSVPQVVLGLTYIDINWNTNQYIVQFDKATPDEFTFQCRWNTGFREVRFSWLAYLDDNLFTQNGQITLPQSMNTVIFQNPQINIPTVSFFITGIDLAAGLLGNFYSSVGTITLMQVDIVITNPYAIPIIYLYYSLIYGQDLNCNYQHQLLNSQLIQYTSQIQVGVISGILEFGYNFFNGARIINYFHEVWTTQVTVIGDVAIDSPNVYTFTTFTAAFCFYTPACPRFCTSCSILGYPYCDACVAGTQRLIAGNCQTCPAPMYASNNFMHCQQCMNVCDSCTTGTTCTVCATLTQRVSPSTGCNQCPLQMFVQTGNLIYCNGYCDGCKYEAAYCISCLMSSGRVNPPLCNQCSLASYYIPEGSVNCEGISINKLGCNNYCNGCSTAANLCLACSIGTQRTNPPLCETCPSQMYVLSSSANCQSTYINNQLACASYCNNCQISSTTCIQCNTITLRIQPPNCFICPTNMFIQAGQDNCQQCNSLCNECLISSTNCISCNGLYRTNAPYCDRCSKQNYYIDPLFNDCQPCASYCNGCTISPTNCIACWPFSIRSLSGTCLTCPTQVNLNPPMCNVNLATYICSINFNRDTSCNCLTGFYDSEDSISCLQCSNICSTCTSQLNCLSCNSSLYLSQPPLCDHCIDGYFMLYGTCTRCPSICSTCSQQQCTTCVSPRQNPPICSCPQGYFDDCTESCSFQCSSCSGSSNHCLQCAGNRINPPFCNCPDGSNQIQEICSSCSLAAPISRFSDDLKSIHVIFSYKLRSPITCISLLNERSLKIIGNDPICTVDQNIILIMQGTNASIIVNEGIFINSGVLYFTNCNISISTIVTPIIQMPLNLFKPSLVFKQDIFVTTPCDVILINVIGTTYNGLRDLKLLNWTLVDGTNNTKINSLITLWNSQQLQRSYIITPEFLINQQSITLEITYRNFLGQVGSSTIKISLQDMFLQLNLQVPERVYIFDTVDISFMAQLLQCSLQSINEAIQIQIYINSSTYQSYNYSLLSDQQEILTFKPFQLALQQTYQIQAVAQYKTYNIQLEKTLQVIFCEISVNILGGDQTIGINQKMQLEAVVLNPNTQQNVNDLTDYSTIWECLDIVTSLQCNNFAYSSFIAHLNTSNYKTYTTLYVTISVYNSTKLVTTNNITVQIQEDYVNIIYITGNQYQLSQPMNRYDEFDVSIHYQAQLEINTDNLTYYASYIDSSYQLNIIQFYYPETSIIVQNFNDTQNTKFKVIIYNPQQSGPSVATLKIRMNIPPQECKLSIYPRGSKFTIQIKSCISQSLPLQYKFIYYTENEGFIQDSQTGFISNGIELNNFSINSYLITYLYGQNTSMIVGIIKDYSNGLSNTSISLAKYQNMDNHQLYYMLQDNRQNLPINIMFIMIFASVNNQILSNEYFNEIKHIVDSFNQTIQVTQYIQQQLASQQTLSNDEIQQQLIKVEQFINTISLNLNELQTWQNNNLYNKNYQIQVIQVEQRLIDISKTISFLYSQSQQVQNRRLLGVLKQNIVEGITNAVSNVNDILSQLTKVNQDKKVINMTQFNVTAQKFTTVRINQEFQLQIINQFNSTVSFKNQNYEINPYQNDSELTVKAPLIVPNLTGANNIQIIPANPIPISFPLIGDVNISCASRIGTSWSLEVCSVVKSSTTLDCLCQTLSPLSITRALEFILGEFDNLFRYIIREKIGLFPYGSSLFTYIIILFLIFYVGSLYQLNRKDNLDYHKVHPDIDIKQCNSEERERINIPDGGQTSMKVIVIDTKLPEENLYTKTSVIGQVKDSQISRYQGFKIFLQNSHVLFELYYRYDEQEPRILRLSILFLQVAGQICIFVLFGKNLVLSIVIGLSIFQTTYGIVFQLILSQMIKSKNRYLRICGLIIAGLLTGLCTYLIIASMALYQSVYYSNIAALSYLASLFGDYFISNILVELCKYTLVLKTCNDQRFYKIYDKILPKGLQEIIFDRILFEAKTKAQIPD